MEDNSHIHNRLDRIEEKIDIVGQALVKLAALEERIAGYMTGTERLGRMLEEQRIEVNAIRDRVRALEMGSIESRNKLAFAERIWWILCSAMLAGALAYFNLPIV